MIAQRPCIEWHELREPTAIAAGFLFRLSERNPPLAPSARIMNRLSSYRSPRFLSSRRVLDMFRTIATFVFTVSLCLLPLAANCGAQGLLLSSDPVQHHRLPRPDPRPIPGQPGFLYDISELEVDASIRDQVAQVQVSQTFKNRTNQTLQVKFVFPLPQDGAIDQMTFMVDGQELEGRLLEADQAREIYQSYVRRSQDPALVQWIGMGMFQTQVFPVPPGAERTVSLRYTQICNRSGAERLAVDSLADEVHVPSDRPDRDPRSSPQSNSSLATSTAPRTTSKSSVTANTESDSSTRPSRRFPTAISGCCGTPTIAPSNCRSFHIGRTRTRTVSSWL